MCCQHLRDCLAAGQVGKGDDSGRNPARRGGGCSRRRRRHFEHRSGFAHWLQPVGTLLRVHRGAFDVYTRSHVVAASIGQKIGDEIAAPGPVPETMMRIEDREVRLEGCFLPSCQPLRPRRDSCGKLAYEDPMG